MKASAVLLLGAMAVGASVRGATTEPARADEIRGLIEKLGSDDYQTRQQAQDQLVRFGVDAKPMLQEMLAKENDPEARTRAESAIAQIDENRVTGPSLVTLHVKDASPEVVLAELSRQGGYEIPTLPENLFKQPGMQWGKMTMDFDQQSFWSVFRAFCEKTGVRPNAMGNDRKFVVMQGGDDSMQGPAVYSGAFMVVANSVTRSSSVNFARDKIPTKSLNIQFSVFAEPKLNILGHDYYLRLSEAMDDRGNSLLMPVPQQYNSMGQDASSRWTLNAALAIPETVGTRITRIKGVSRVLMQTKSERWDVPGIGSIPANGVSKSIGGRKYVVEDFKAAGVDSYQLKLTMIREGARQSDWQQNGRGVRIIALDAEGKSLALNGWGGGGSNERLTYTYTFNQQNGMGGKTGPAKKLVIEVPTEVKEVDVPFEFKDLILP
ncbi:MAG TPA: HEAT repeat domain-containing protein [Tepidisphaeraceae bacterium]|nr:HEAT repeat domain-containing protein [Tepidisphaeraceae bacterium]